MPLKTSSRGAVDPFIVMDMMRAAADLERSGRNITHMEVGQPGTAAPQAVIEAAEAALRDNRLGYCDALGLPELRSRIAEHYADFYGAEVAPHRIIVTTGASAGFMMTVLATFDSGDRVAVTAPGYPAYRNMLVGLGITPLELTTTSASRFQMTAEILAQADRAGGGAVDGAVVTSPSNPTGTMISASQLDDLYEYCDRHEIRLISDEIYHGIDYGMAPSTAARFSDAIVINSFSKYFSMTGWRIGWIVVPDDLVRPIERLLQNFFISTATLSQLAALKAFDCHEELQLNIAGYAKNRELLLRDLPKAGFSKLAPVDGAFYIYADIGELTNDSAAFCRAMLAEAGVAATPGIDFDPVNGSRFIRFCFAGTNDDAAAAAARLIAWRAGSSS